MAVSLTKLTLVIGAGLVGSALSSEVRIWDVGNFVSGAFKIVTKSLQQAKDKSVSAGKPQPDALLAQVNNLRQELQLLASSRAVTIVTGRRSGSGTYSVAVIIVVGVAGYGYIRWKGWKLSDMMFVTRRGFSDACNSIGKDVDGLESSISTTKREVGSRIAHTENSIDEITAVSTSIRNEVSLLTGEMREIQEKTGIVYDAVHNLESRLLQIDSNQDVNNQGIVLLCDFVHQNLEKSKKAESIQSSQSNSSRPPIGHQPNVAVSRTVSLPPLALEAPPTSPSPSPSSSSSTDSPKILHSCAISSSGLKGLQDVSNEVKSLSSRRTSGLSNVVPTIVEEPTSASSSSRFWSKLPGGSILTRARSTIS